MMTPQVEVFPGAKEWSLLQDIDFIRFCKSYGEIISNYIPSAERTDFYVNREALLQRFKSSSRKRALEDVSAKIVSGEQAFSFVDDHLLLSFDIRPDGKVFALISGIDPLFAQRAGDDWLNATLASIAREFLLFKQGRVDQSIGLLNLFNLQSLINSFADDEQPRLLLVEVPPVRVAQGNIHAHSQKIASLLNVFFDRHAALHFLGHSVFAYVSRDDGTGSGVLEGALINYFKKAGYKRVHVGAVRSKSGMEKIDVVVENPCPDLLDKAWTALRYAVRRGPYSHCDYQVLAAPESHPLANPGPGSLVVLKKLLARHQTSSLLFTDVHLTNTDSKWFHQNAVCVRDREYSYLFLPDVTSDKVLSLWYSFCASKTDLIPAKPTAGISMFPFHTFSKNNTIQSCRKAYQHALLLGKGETAVFDALSLNVSGDIYFSDGDMMAAVREYRLGLQLSPGDVNLLNSLGVTYALMDQTTKAGDCFQDALKSDQYNFMALYNLGLCEYGKKNNETALNYFLKAAEQIEDAEDYSRLNEELFLQIGQLAADLGYHELALQYLDPKKLETLQGSSHFSRGAAFYGLGENKQAMVELQRALRFDQFAAQSMSLLGKIYHEEGQGDEIALSLCKKSFQIDPASQVNRLYYAEMLAASGEFAESKAVLRQCMANTKTRKNAQLLMARIYFQENKYSLALNWLGKLLVKKSSVQLDQKMRDAAWRLKKEIEKTIKKKKNT